MVDPVTLKAQQMRKKKAMGEHRHVHAALDTLLLSPATALQTVLVLPALRDSTSQSLDPCLAAFAKRIHLHCRLHANALLALLILKVHRTVGLWHHAYALQGSKSFLENSLNVWSAAVANSNRNCR